MFLKHNNLRFSAYRIFGFSLLPVFAVCSSVPAMSVEIYDKKFLFDIDKEINKLLKPITKLDMSSSLDDIAKAAAKFKKGLDFLYNTGISIDQAFDLCLNQLSQKGIRLKKSHIKPLIKRIKHYEAKGFEKDFTLDCEKSSHKEDIEMPSEAILGCVQIFCGVLLCVIPYPTVQSAGIGLIGSGVTMILLAYDEENRKKLLWIQSYEEMFSHVDRRNDQKIFEIARPDFSNGS